MQPLCVVGTSEDASILYVSSIGSPRWTSIVDAAVVADQRGWYIPVFTLEELVAVLHLRFGIDYIGFDALTVEHAADVYLDCVKTPIPEKPLEIKLGGIYRMRNGEAAMVYAIFKHGSWPVQVIELGAVSDLMLFSVSKSGRNIDNEMDSKRDIVEALMHVTNYEFRNGDPMWRRKSDGMWVRSVVNETYLELIKEDPYSYAPVYENGRFVRSDVGEAELMRQAFMESMKKW